MIVNPPYGADEFLRRAYAAIHRGSRRTAQATSKWPDLTPERMAQ